MSWVTKSILKRLLGEAGAGLDESFNGTNRLYQNLKTMVLGLRSRLLYGMEAADPTTPSAQAAGVGNTTWNVNVGAGKVVVNNVQKVFAAAADFSVHAGSLLLTNGQSVVAALVAKNVSGTVTTVAVKGTAATTGSQVAPTNAEIQAALGVGIPWVKLAHLTLNRTGDTTVTQSQDNEVSDHGDEITVE